MKKIKIIVVGAGASGLLASAEAAKSGAEVLLLEKMKKVAMKLCITGKGRCNITNIADLRSFITHFGKNGRFLRQCFHRYFTSDLMEFLEDEGLKLVSERGGRVFPASGKAPDVTNTLLRYAKKNSVKVETSSPVTKLLIEDDKIYGVEVNGKEILADRVILALGGASYPRTGSTGDGYKLAKSAGHNIVPIRPALVPLITAENSIGKSPVTQQTIPSTKYLGKSAFKGRSYKNNISNKINGSPLAGLNLRNVGVTLFIDNKKSKSLFGELVFTDFGITGPITLTLSSEIIDLLAEDKKVEISIDLKPALNEKKLDGRLIRDFTARSTEPLSSVLRGLIPKEMVSLCINDLKISPKKSVNQISSKERKSLLHWLKNFRFEIVGNRPISEAIVTAGGVDLKEINPKNMESKICSNLYIIGELLDLNGNTGGYNLQAAFSTGWVAGQIEE